MTRQARSSGLGSRSSLSRTLGAGDPRLGRNARSELLDLDFKPPLRIERTEAGHRRRTHRRLEIERAEAVADAVAPGPQTIALIPDPGTATTTAIANKVNTVITRVNELGDRIIAMVAVQNTLLRALRGRGLMEE